MAGKFLVELVANGLKDYEIVHRLDAAQHSIGAGAYKPLHAESYFGMVGMVLVVIARFGLMPALARRDRDLELDAILKPRILPTRFFFC